MGKRLTSSHLVGRQGQLAELELAFHDAADGRAGVVLLGGESGVGKTRLLTALIDSIAAGDATTRAQATAEPTVTLLRSECIEQGDIELPYAPLIAALRPLARQRHPALDQISPSSRAQLAVLLPTLGPAATERERPNGGDGSGQLRLFEALLDLLDTLSSSTPLLLVIEDIHWADRATRAFLAFLASSLGGERILVTLSFRSDEMHRRHPLRPLLADLDRISRTRRLALEPFDRPELTEALTDILGTAPDEALLDRLIERTDGNPLFVEELLAASLDGRGAAPQSLSDAFMLRIERLSPDARVIANVVAVTVRADETLIAAVSGLDRTALHEGLRGALAEHVLVSIEDGRFRFRHALLREVLYEEMLPGERSELHLRVAQALEADSPALSAADPAAVTEDVALRISQTARHYEAVGDQPSALAATVRAALAAKRIRAHAEVARLAERAIELWPRVPDAEAVAGTDRVTLLQLAAAGHGLSAAMQRAEHFWELAVAETDPQSDPLLHGRLLASLARNRWQLNRGPEALELAQRALEIIPEGAPERIGVRAWLARTRVLRGRYAEAKRDGELALTAARAAGHECTAGEILNTLGVANVASGEVELGERQLREAIRIAREFEDMDDLGTAYTNLADALNLAGRTRDALAVIEAGLQEMPPRLPRTAGWMLMTQAEMAFEAGDWSKAREVLSSTGENEHGTALMYRLLHDAEVALGMGDDARAAEKLAAAEPLVRVTTQAQYHRSYGSLVGELHRRCGNLEAAQRAVAAALDELEVCTDDVMRIARVSAVGASIEADRLLRARDLRDAEAEADALVRAELHISRLAAAAECGGPVERAWQMIGAAHLARGRAQNDPALWEQAAGAFEEIGRPYPAATQRWRAAEAYLEAGDRDAAAGVACQSLEVASRLGAGWLCGELTALIARGRLQVTPDSAETPDGAGAPTPDAGGARDPAEIPFGLTPRELQVLALVAGGATNRQIGAALFMAEKTASVHVSRILAKLGVSTRTQAAAVAHRLHLVALAEPAVNG